MPHTFPIELADALRAKGVQITPDRAFFDKRRRAKNDAEIAGIRRRSAGPRLRWTPPATCFRARGAAERQLVVDGETLTCELVKARITDVFNQHGLVADEMIVAHGTRLRSATTSAPARSRPTSRSSSTSSRATASRAATPT